MMKRTGSVSILVALVLTLCCSCTSAFSVGRPSSSRSIAEGFRLAAQTPEPEEPMASETADVAADEDNPSATTDDTSAEAPEESKEKDEVAALKAEISDLETTLKTLRSSLAWTTDKADDFSKAGYARKVAELESMRRSSQVRTYTTCLCYDDDDDDKSLDGTAKRSHLFLLRRLRPHDDGA
jgi:hypothetical protein